MQYFTSGSVEPRRPPQRPRVSPFSSGFPWGGMGDGQRPTAPHPRPSGPARLSASLRAACTPRCGPGDGKRGQRPAARRRRSVGRGPVPRQGGLPTPTTNGGGAQVAALQRPTAPLPAGPSALLSLPASLRDACAILPLRRGLRQRPAARRRRFVGRGPVPRQGGPKAPTTNGGGAQAAALKRPTAPHPRPCGPTTPPPVARARSYTIELHVPIYFTV